MCKWLVAVRIVVTCLWFLFCVCCCFAFRLFADMWSSEHQQYFDAIDTTCGSKLLVTTRIKNLLSSRGVEVELELLGLQGTSSMCLQRYTRTCMIDTRSRCAESVELLAGVAELDVDQVPPMCLEIAQLCGRLPLCLNIVGR